MITHADHSPEGAVAVIRDSRSDDAPSIAELLDSLGYPSPIADVERRIAAGMDSAGTAIFVAESSSRIVGAISFHCIPLFHANGFLGRITSLVVALDFRQRGIGHSLVLAAEKFAWTHGCTRIEVTSGDHRPDAHAFYEHIGYRCDCRRFIKQSQNV